MQAYIDFVLQHWALSGAFGAVLTLLVLTELRNQLSGAQLLSPQEATRLINHEKALLLDVRPEDAFKQGHIAGSKHRTPEALQTKEPMKIFNNKTVIVVCDSGSTSLRCANVLRKQGVAPVYVLKQGLQSWRDAQLPLVQH